MGKPDLAGETDRRGAAVAALGLCAACKTANTEKSPAAPAGQAAAAMDPATPIATMDGKPITYAELEKEQKDLPGKVKIHRYLLT